MTSDPTQLPYRHSVGLCLFNNQGLVLIAERRDRRGAWQMPQGGVMKGEPLHVTALRELKEEIGTDKAEIIAHIAEKLSYDFPDWLQYRGGVFRGKYRGQQQDWFALRYLGNDSDIDLSGEHEPELPEFVAWRWAALEETPGLVVDFKRPVYDRVVKDFASMANRIRKGEMPTPLRFISDPK
jgi:putative (di)nucleoside polyphosphate hydrolase